MGLTWFSKTLEELGIESLLDLDDFLNKNDK